MNQQLRKYTARTMKDAIASIKKELGPQAVVISVRQIKSGGKPMLEVTAAPNDYNIAPVSNRKVKGKAKNPYLQNQTGQTAESNQTTVDSKGNMQIQFRDLEKNLSNCISSQIDSCDLPSKSDMQTRFEELKNLLVPLVHSAQASKKYQLPQNFANYVYQLTEAGLDEMLAEELVRITMDKINRNMKGYEESVNDRTINYYLRQLLEKNIKVCKSVLSEKGGWKVVAFVGATGVGKTTTVAKLAAITQLKANKKVGLITIDTYRIAAIEQLRKYADIMGLPLEVAVTREGLVKALKRFENMDMVLIDTAGRNPLDKGSISSLKEMFNGLPIEVHLTLSATTDDRTNRRIAANFQELGYDHLLFTKLDETLNYGTIFNTYLEAKKTLSFLTTGQKVPEDIEIASAAKIATLLLDHASGLDDIKGKSKAA